MRFVRQTKKRFRDSPRARAAYRAKLRREQAAMPLFADEVAEAQLSEEEEFTRRRHEWIERERRDRAETASWWRKARSKLRAHPDRHAIYSAWQRHKWLPGKPWYLDDFIDHWKRRNDQGHEDQNK